MEYFRFAHSGYLYALLLIPVFIGVFWMMMHWRKKALNRFGENSLLSRLIPEKSGKRPVLKFVILMLAFIFLVVGLANPQVGSKLEKAERKGIDLMIALDVSNSMLAEDIKPNRLARAKQAISRLLDKLQGDRVGLVVFAGKAYIQLPITTDYAAARLFLNSVETDILPVQGTAIADAIRKSVASFQENDHQRAVVVITDGENHEGDAIEAVKEAVEKGITVYTIGMGLPDGAPIPVYNRYGNMVGYKKDNMGGTVVTKLNENMLRQLASAGNGTYVRANNTEAGLNKIFEEINKMEKKEFESRVFSDYEDRFQYFMAIAVFLLIIEIFIVDRKSRWWSRIKLFSQ